MKYKLYMCWSNKTGKGVPVFQADNDAEAIRRAAQRLGCSEDEIAVVFSERDSWMDGPPPK